MVHHLCVALALACVVGSYGFTSSCMGHTMSGFAVPMHLKTGFSTSSVFPALRAPVSAAFGHRAKSQSASTIVMAAYGQDLKPKATKELLQVRFAKSSPEALKAWIQKWPTGAAKDNYGLPKLMLPVSWEKLEDESVQGLKLIFKGSLDPWLQIQLEGDTVRVYRCTGLATTNLQVSALKEREESKICDKLKLDLNNFGEMKEFDIPKPKKEEPVVADSDAAEVKEEEAAPPA